jgi:hypothetical protein
MVTAMKRSDIQHWELPDDLYAGPGIRGLYHPLQFVVRLQPELRDQLSRGPIGVQEARQLNTARLTAFGTYLHETIHWWQHIGSTIGLMLSFAYPAQAHINHRHLLTILGKCGPQKSLKSFLENNYSRLDESTRSTLNIVLNNWHDVEFNRRLILNSASARQFVENTYFESVGHSLFIGLSHTIWMLASTFDEQFQFLPDIRRWDDLFQALSDAKVDGYYYRSSIRLPPVGAIHIFEGQTRFNQMQYLSLASDAKLDWDDFRSMGMFGETYLRAFKTFLEWTESSWPDRVLHPLVYLFLLVCDVAINPSDGFPFDIWHPESFIESVDPGFRFIWFSRHIRENPGLKEAIQRATKDEYLAVAESLARCIGSRTPVAVAELLCTWATSATSIKALLDEEHQFSFGDKNMPVRVLFAQHLRFAEDRARRPEFFCWPGLHFVHRLGSDFDIDESARLFKKHEPLFVADIDGEVRPSLRPGRDPANIQQTFNDFYGWGVTYDMIKQWTVNDGPFAYDYSWLAPTQTDKDIKHWAGRHFEIVFGIAPDAFGSI